MQPVHPKGDQSWVFSGRTDVEAPVLWPPDVKSWLIGKDPDAGKDWRWEEKGTTGWDGWMVSLTQWTWVWASCGSWWWTGRPGVLRSVGSQRARRDWATDLTPVMLDGSGIQTRVGEEILMDKSQGAVFLKPFRAAEGEERSPKGRVVVIYYSFLESLLTILWAR